MAPFTHLILVLVLTTLSIDSGFSETDVDDNCRQVTEALKEKWRIAFDISNIDKDDIFTVEKMYTNLQKLIAYSHASKDQIPDIMEWLVLYTEVIEAYFGVNNTKTGLTRSEWVMAFGWYWSKRFDLLYRRLYPFYTTVFHAIDRDNDGLIQFGEFQRYYKQYGIIEEVEEKTREAFNVIDANNDRVLSEDEYRDAYLKFLLDPDSTAKELPVY